MKWIWMIKRLLIIIAINCISTTSGVGQIIYKWDQSIEVLQDEKDLILPWAGGINAAQVSTLDLDDDGREDLVIFDRTNEKISTYLNTNEGRVYAPEYEAYFPDRIEGWLLLRDYNCDGRKDLFTHTPFGIKVYENITGPGQPPAWQLVQDPIFTVGASGQINLQVNILDLPGIDDIDGDGDLDILVYDFAAGGGIELHKNISVQNTGNCGLEFERVSKMWGEFLECECDIFAFNGELCEDFEPKARTKHIGGKTILTFDIDNDGDKEVLIGQEDCESLYFLENKGTQGNAFMDEFSMQFPNEINPITYFTFPAAYFEDLDGDGEKDLISSTNFSFNSEGRIDFQHSFWFYRNAGTTLSPDFQFISADYLQGDMIDLGELTSPALVDFDKDGDQDLFVSNKGNYSGSSSVGSLYYYKNAGTSSSPDFELVEDDYLGLGSLGLTDLKIQFEDLTGDGNRDLILTGSQDGVNSSLILLPNQSSNVFSFDLQDKQDIPVDLSAEDNFHFAKINGDQLTDLLVARGSGRLDYYQNVGASNSPTFVLDTENFLGIIDDFSRKNLSVAVADLDGNGSYDLLTGDETGNLSWYSDFQNSMNPVREDLMFDGISPDTFTSHNFGNEFSITTGQLFNEVGPAILIGLKTGGLQILRKTNAQPFIPSEEGALVVIVFPNPSADTGDDFVSVSSNENGTVHLLSLNGQRLSSEFMIYAGEILKIDTGYLRSGIYLLKVQAITGKVATRPLVIIR